MSQPAKRACDACHRRKVKCNCETPCRNCSQAGLNCTYDAIPQKKGPKGSRAKVIAELRDAQKQTTLSQGRPVHNRQASGASPPRSPPDSPTFDLLSPGLIEDCAEYFCAEMYPTMPILHREQLRRYAQEMNSTPEAYCLVASLCAFVLIQPGIITRVQRYMETTGETMTGLNMGSRILDEVVRVRKQIDYIENPTIHSVITSFFIFGSCFNLNKHNSGSHHLREATTMALNMGMNDEDTYQSGDLDSGRKRRLFWLLFITERAYAIQKRLPLSLHPTIDVPKVDQDSSTMINGFNYLIALYRSVDDEFIGLWNVNGRRGQPLNTERLQHDILHALPPHLNTTESQAADLRVSQQWLRSIVWQLATSNGYLSSTSSSLSATFAYPLVIAQDLVNVTQSFSKQAMEAHGIGLVEKLFDVAYILVDVMSCTIPDSVQILPPQELLQRLLVLISQLRGGNTKYVPLIMAKVQENFGWMITSLTDAMNNAKAMQFGTDHAAAVTMAMSNASIMAAVSVPPLMMPMATQTIGPPGMVNGNHMGVQIKNEPHHRSSNSSSVSNTPYNTPPYPHYYSMT